MLAGNIVPLLIPYLIDTSALWQKHQVWGRLSNALGKWLSEGRLGSIFHPIAQNSSLGLTTWREASAWPFAPTLLLGEQKFCSEGLEAKTKTRETNKQNPSRNTRLSRREGAQTDCSRMGTLLVNQQKHHNDFTSLLLYCQWVALDEAFTYDLSWQQRWDWDGEWSPKLKGTILLEVSEWKW